MELTYVLYSLLRKGVQRNFDKGRSYGMQVAFKITQGQSTQAFFTSNPHCCRWPPVTTAPTVSPLLSQ